MDRGLTAVVSNAIPNAAIRKPTIGMDLLIPEDPCQLVAEGDLSRAMDIPVVKRGPVPKEAMILPGGPPLTSCRAGYSTVVAVEPRDLASFIRERDGDPPNIRSDRWPRGRGVRLRRGVRVVRVGGGYVRSVCISTLAAKRSATFAHCRASLSAAFPGIRAESASSA